MGPRTDKFSTVSDLVIPEVCLHIPVFHPFGHDAKHGLIDHLDTLDRQDVVIFDLFRNQHLLAKFLEVT